MRTGISIGLCSLFIVMLVPGCASTPEGLRDPHDPWEPFNRGVYKFNTDLDNAFLKPIAKGYQAVTPEPVDRGVTNFFGNLADVGSAINNLLQFKLARAGSDVGRVVVNSTVGVLGFVDVASNMGIASYKEDFGQTLGYWGVGSGPYLMLPLLGPSSVRDTIGLAGDILVDPLLYVPDEEIYWGVAALRTIDRRADLLTAEAIFDEAAIDRYTFLRDAYLQRRETQVRDGTLSGEAAPDIWEDDDEVAPIDD